MRSLCTLTVPSPGVGPLLPFPSRNNSWRATSSVFTWRDSVNVAMTLLRVARQAEVGEGQKVIKVSFLEATLAALSLLESVHRQHGIGTSIQRRVPVRGSGLWKLNAQPRTPISPGGSRPEVPPGPSPRHGLLHRCSLLPHGVCSRHGVATDPPHVPHQLPPINSPLSLPVGHISGRRGHRRQRQPRLHRMPSP